MAHDERSRPDRGGRLFLWPWCIVLGVWLLSACAGTPTPGLTLTLPLTQQATASATRTATPVVTFTVASTATPRPTGTATPAGSPTPTVPVPRTLTATPTASPRPGATATLTASTSTTTPAMAVSMTPVLTPFATSLPFATLSPPIEEWPLRVLYLFNAVRAEFELPPYAYDQTLARAARTHALDCHVRGSCSHTGADGSSVEERIERAGYDAIGWAEVIAYASSPEEAVARWLDEEPPDDPHRRTLLGTWVTEMGVGITPAEQEGYYYFVVDLGRPASP